MRSAVWLLPLVVLLAGRPAAGADPSAPAPVRLDLQREWREQHSELCRQLGERAWLDKIAGQARHPAGLIAAGDRDPADVVLRRTGALLDAIRSLPDAPELSAAGRRLAALRERAAAVPASDAAGRYALYTDACRLRRQIAFANPLLKVRRLLFIRRERAAYDHMCDQFYGFNARPGGALLVLEDPFGPAPAVRDLLAGSPVENGRLKGRSLAGGSFLSPDASWDGRSLLFAYTQAVKTAPAWSPERSFHVFRVEADGSHLRQLTDGSWNEFDPCWLPDGRVAFISERRGGYLRCSGDRPCPVYTLHRMNADGSDITRLSFHETHEWQPSVANDGMLLYTRWDYVDRDTNSAHHPWVTTPDGCDPRALQGNYPTERGGRPWMEMDVRAVPGSRKLISTAATHHGQAYGSLVLVDPDREDDGAMAQVQRLTPDTPFPEAESGKKGTRSCQVYATPWPLSEDFWLCAYDPATKNYGIYLADSFGNRELLYRDPAMSCLSPMPLAGRPRPPILPERTVPGAHEATVTLANVYDSQAPWPKDTRITALRVIQLLPKTTVVQDVPRIGVARQANARAVLGTVPVEADGSACFAVPAGKPIYFQALDERGMAVQSMRSVTYLQPGEQLSCQGCHERRPSAAPGRPAALSALRRAPSRLEPEPDGSNPLNYPRLVQGVLDRHCAGCHAQNKKAPDLRGSTANSSRPPAGTGWAPSYLSLAPKYGFTLNSTNGSFADKAPRGGAVTVPGQFGARASRLLATLGPEHYGVRLPAEEFHRITLWLDCNCDYYGAYENIEAQSRGEVVRPALE